MARSFQAQIRDWNKKTLDQQKRVLQQSLNDVLDIAQTPVAKGGNMPVDTGFLRNSLVSELNGAQIAKGPDNYTLAIAQMDAGDYARFGWAAAYARVRHYKPQSFGQGGGYWRDHAAAQWQDIVRRNARKVQ